MKDVKLILCIISVLIAITGSILSFILISHSIEVDSSGWGWGGFFILLTSYSYSYAIATGGKASIISFK